MGKGPNERGEEGEGKGEGKEENHVSTTEG